jgi:Cu-processing system permease protein
MILAVLILITIAATLAMLTYRDPGLFSSGLTRSFELFGFIIVTITPFVALMSFFNTFASSARLAFVFAILFFTAGKIIVALLTWQVSALSVLEYVFPGYQLEQMAGQNGGLMLNLGLPLLQTTILLIVAQRIFARSSI